MRLALPPSHFTVCATLLLATLAGHGQCQRCRRVQRAPSANACALGANRLAFLLLPASSSSSQHALPVIRVLFLGALQMCQRGMVDEVRNHVQHAPAQHCKHSGATLCLALDHTDHALWFSFALATLLH